jgi:hypothetical protein
MSPPLQNWWSGLAIWKAHLFLAYPQGLPSGNVDLTVNLLPL